MGNPSGSRPVHEWTGEHVVGLEQARDLVVAQFPVLRSATVELLGRAGTTRFTSSMRVGFFGFRGALSPYRYCVKKSTSCPAWLAACRYPSQCHWARVLTVHLSATLAHYAAEQGRDMLLREALHGLTRAVGD